MAFPRHHSFSETVFHWPVVPIWLGCLANKPQGIYLSTCFKVPSTEITGKLPNAPCCVLLVYSLHWLRDQSHALSTLQTSVFPSHYYATFSTDMIIVCGYSMKPYSGIVKPYSVCLFFFLFFF